MILGRFESFLVNATDYIKGLILPSSVLVGLILTSKLLALRKTLSTPPSDAPPPISATDRVNAKVLDFLRRKNIVSLCFIREIEIEILNL